MTSRTARTRFAAVACAATLVALCAVPGGAAASSAHAPRLVSVARLAPSEEEVRSWALSPAGAGDVATRDEFSYQADPGTSIDDAVTLYNLGNVQLTFRVYAADGYTTDDGQFSVRSGSEEPVDAGSWVTLEQELVTVPAGQQVTIPMTVDVPVSASPGDHAAGVVATVYEERQLDPDQPVEVEFRTGTRMYVRVSGNATTSLGLSAVDVAYSAGRNPFDGSADVTFRVQNLGNLRLGGSATVSLHGPFGLGSTTVTVPEMAELLPGGEMSVTTRVDGVPASGLITATVHLVPDAVDGVAAAPDVEGSANTIAVPWALVLLALLMLLAILAARAIRRHRLADAAASGVPVADFRLP